MHRWRLEPNHSHFIMVGNDNDDWFCEQLLRVAVKVCDDVIWVKGSVLQLPKVDGWHFAEEAKEALVEIMRSLNVHIGGGRGRDRLDAGGHAPL